MSVESNRFRPKKQWSCKSCKVMYWPAGGRTFYCPKCTERNLKKGVRYYHIVTSTIFQKEKKCWGVEGMAQEVERVRLLLRKAAGLDGA